MKKWLILLILVAAALGGLGWRNTKRLTEASEQLRRVRAEAAQLGIFSQPAPEENARITKTTRQTATRTGRALAIDTIAYLKESQAAMKGTGPHLINGRERYMNIIDQIKAMNATQLRGYVAEILACEDLPEDLRKSMARAAMNAIVDDRPAEVLELLSAMPGLLDDRTGDVVYKAIHIWTETDPAAALAWVRKTIAVHPEQIGDKAKASIIHGIAAQDSKLAFTLIGEFGITAPKEVIQGLVSATKAPDQRTKVIAELREFLPTIKNKRERQDAGDYALATLGRVMATEGFKTSSAWADQAALTPREISYFGSEISDSIIDGEAGHWIEWFGRNLPASLSGREIYPIMSKWTEKDYKVAGAWLNTQGTGDTKNKAISAYAQIVAKYEPADAVRWATTIRPGDIRDNTLFRIYCNWPKDDPSAAAAAEAFAKEYAVEH